VNLLRGVSAGPTNHHTVTVLLPLQYGPRPQSEFATHLGRYGDLSLRRELRRGNRHHGIITTVMRREQCKTTARCPSNVPAFSLVNCRRVGASLAGLSSFRPPPPGGNQPRSAIASGVACSVESLRQISPTLQSTLMRPRAAGAACREACLLVLARCDQRTNSREYW
jgi:hypothetical protein